VEVRCDSVCIHSDTPGVAGLAEAIVRGLGENGVEVRAIGRSRERVS
jgi:lactam utilization protein B